MASQKHSKDNLEETENTSVPGEAGDNEETAPEQSQQETLMQEVASLNDKLLRTMAEYDNFRKRSQKERESIYPQATADTVLKFLPIVDNFERALSAECSDEGFKKGVEMIFTSFKEILEKLGVEVIDGLGETFNPELHNAVMHIEDPEKGENEITMVMQKGYKIGERVIRYAMVQVAN